VLSAAFLGPGTVTTAASAGASFGLQLGWALVFSTVACIVLQEAVARLVLVTGDSLGAAIRTRAGGGTVGRGLALLVGFSIVLGCAAYEAGNILGGVAGLELILGGPSAGTIRSIALLSGLAAAVLLWSGNAARIARVLGALVAVMGLAFVVTAFRLGPDGLELVHGCFVPRLPGGSEVLALGLVGTTVVPYNLFLGAGLARGQTPREMRWGLVLAVGLGGMISLAVLVAGSGLAGTMSFEALKTMLDDRLGSGAGTLFALGLFAAGFSSAVTAPWAAALAARSLARDAEDSHWGERSPRTRAVWLGVLIVGIGFGVSGVKPVPVIVLAQALNGLALPLVATLVMLAVNDPTRMGSSLNGSRANLLGLVCVAVTIAIGVNGLARVVSTLLDRPSLHPAWVVRLAAVLVLWVAVLLWRSRRPRGR
jgi:Mn2+/Fe2+ NRAMP family transporter